MSLTIGRRRRNNVAYRQMREVIDVANNGPINSQIARSTPDVAIRPSASPKSVGNSFPVLLTDSEVRPVLNGNPNRSYLLFQNTGTQTIFLSFGSRPTNSAGRLGALRIPPDGFYELDSMNVFTNNVWGVSESGDNFLTVVEGVFT